MGKQLAQGVKKAQTVVTNIVKEREAALLKLRIKEVEQADTAKEE